MLESLCIGQIIIAAILIGTILTISLLVKPTPITYVMTTAEEEQFNIQKSNGSFMFVFVHQKESIHHGNKKEEPSRIQCR
jgi:hypothetical protein